MTLHSVKELVIKRCTIMKWCDSWRPLYATCLKIRSYRQIKKFEATSLPFTFSFLRYWTKNLNRNAWHGRFSYWAKISQPNFSLYPFLAAAAASHWLWSTAFLSWILQASGVAFQSMKVNAQSCRIMGYSRLSPSVNFFRQGKYWKLISDYSLMEMQ